MLFSQVNPDKEEINQQDAAYDPCKIVQNIDIIKRSAGNIKLNVLCQKRKAEGECKDQGKFQVGYVESPVTSPQYEQGSKCKMCEKMLQVIPSESGTARFLGNSGIGDH